MKAFRSSSAEETHRFARDCASTLQRGAVVALSGELGAGKTKFTQGVAESFGVTEPVTSPTFVLLNRYAGRPTNGGELFVYHFDLYRVQSAAELYDIGFEEFVNGNGITLIEWAERFPELLPSNRTDVRLRHDGVEHERIIEVERVEAAVAMS